MSGGKWGEGPRGLPFPPPPPLLRSHYPLHSQTSNSPLKSASECPDSQYCCACTHTHTQRPYTPQCRRHRHYTNLATMPFFPDLVTSGYISSFHHSTKHPGSVYPACNNTEPRPLGCFHTVINGLSESLYISCCSG